MKMASLVRIRESMSESEHRELRANKSLHPGGEIIARMEG
jgi:hypothetical protein